MLPALAVLVLAASPLVDPHPSYIEAPEIGGCRIELPADLTVEFEADVPLEPAGNDDPGHLVVRADPRRREHTFWVRVTPDAERTAFWKQIIVRAGGRGAGGGACRVSQPSAARRESTPSDNARDFNCKVTFRRGEATLEMLQGTSCVLSATSVERISI